MDVGAVSFATPPLYDRAAARSFASRGHRGVPRPSPRSQLQGQNSVRCTPQIQLDLYYVESWPMIGGFLKSMRTARTGIGSDGAY